MNLKKCQNGHFYDLDTYSECPHCAEMNDSNSHTMHLDSDDAKTQSLGSFTNIAPTEPLENKSEKSDLRQAVEAAAMPPKKNLIFSDEQENKTVGLYKRTIGSEPVVGWLVCIKGGNFGEDFKLISGRNFIGRSSNMQVSISMDGSVSRERHAAVIYEPKKSMFLAQPGDSKELFYVNGEVVLSATSLKVNDVIEIGETQLMFIPCCSDAFTWNKEN